MRHYGINWKPELRFYNVGIFHHAVPDLANKGQADT
jgi:hypothetical protein